MSASLAAALLRIAGDTRANLVAAQIADLQLAAKMLQPPEHSIYAEVAAERARAHEKHRRNPGGSIEDRDPEHWRWFTILGEEKGEVDKAANDYEHGLYTHDEYLAELRKELIQVAAVACAWADKLGELT